MIAFLDLLKEPFCDVVGADGLPVRWGEAVKGETSLTVTPETLDSSWIGFLILGTKGSQQLVSLLPTLLIKDGFEFGLHSVVLLFGNVAKDIIHFVDDAALALRGGKLGRNRIQHRLVAVCDPEIHLG